MDEAVRLTADENGYFTLYSGDRALVHGLDPTQAQRFADSLDGVLEGQGGFEVVNGATDFD